MHQSFRALRLVRGQAGVPGFGKQVFPDRVKEPAPCWVEGVLQQVHCTESETMGAATPSWPQGITGLITAGQLPQEWLYRGERGTDELQHREGQKCRGRAGPGAGGGAGQRPAAEALQDSSLPHHSAFLCHQLGSLHGARVLDHMTSGVHCSPNDLFLSNTIAFTWVLPEYRIQKGSCCPLKALSMLPAYPFRALVPIQRCLTLLECFPTSAFFTFSLRALFSFNFKDGERCRKDREGFSIHLFTPPDTRGGGADWSQED